MSVDELITALRTKESRDNRQLLDEAADVIEAAVRDIRLMMKFNYDECYFCKNYKQEAPDVCKLSHGDCQSCDNSDCPCEHCGTGDNSNFEWRVLQCRNE